MYISYLLTIMGLTVAARIAARPLTMMVIVVAALALLMRANEIISTTSIIIAIFLVTIALGTVMIALSPVIITLSPVTITLGTTVATVVGLIPRMSTPRMSRFVFGLGFGAGTFISITVFLLKTAFAFFLAMLVVLVVMFGSVLSAAFVILTVLITLVPLAAKELSDAMVVAGTDLVEFASTFLDDGFCRVRFDAFELAAFHNFPEELRQLLEITGRIRCCQDSFNAEE